jgi:hypothetical protein
MMRKMVFLLAFMVLGGFGLPLFYVPVVMRVYHTADLHPIVGPFFMRI